MITIIIAIIIVIGGYFWFSTPKQSAHSGTGPLNYLSYSKMSKLKNVAGKYVKDSRNVYCEINLNCLLAQTLISTCAAFIVLVQTLLPL